MEDGGVGIYEDRERVWTGLPAVRAIRERPNCLGQWS